jgi:hypothetical protein
VYLTEERQPIGRLECPNAPKLTARSKAGANGSDSASARTPSTAGRWDAPGAGKAAAVSASMPALKSTPVSRSSQFPQHTDPGSGTTAHIES